MPARRQLSTGHATRPPWTPSLSLKENGPNRSRSTPGPSSSRRDKCETKDFSPKRRVHFSPAAVFSFRTATAMEGVAGGKPNSDATRRDAHPWPRSTEADPSKWSTSWISANLRQASGNAAKSAGSTRSSSGGAGVSLRAQRTRSDDSTASMSASATSPDAGRAPAAGRFAPSSRSARMSAGSRRDFRPVAGLGDQCPAPLDRAAASVAANGIDHHSTAVRAELLEPVGHPFQGPRDRCDRAHHSESHRPAQQPQADMQRLQFQAGMEEHRAGAVAFREEDADPARR